MYTNDYTYMDCYNEIRETLDRLNSELSPSSLYDKTNKKKRMKIKALIGIESALSKIVFSIDCYNIDSKSKSAVVEEIAPYLTSGEQFDLIVKVNTCIEKENIKRKKEIDIQATKANDLINKYFSNEYLNIDGITTNLSGAFKRLVSLKKQEFNDTEKLDLPSEKLERLDSGLKEKLDLILATKELKDNELYKKINRNYKLLIQYDNSLKNAYSEASRIENYTNIDGSVFGPVRDYLKILVASRKKEYNKANWKLQKFDLKIIEDLYNKALQFQNDKIENEKREERIKDRYYNAVMLLEEMRRKGASPADITKQEKLCASLKDTGVDLAEVEKRLEKNLTAIKMAQKDSLDKKAKDAALSHAENDAADKIDVEVKKRFVLNQRPSSKFKPFNSKSEKLTDEEIKAQIKKQVIAEGKKSPILLAMEQLTSEGAIPKNTKYDKLNSTQRQMVEIRANHIAKLPYYKAMQTVKELDGNIDNITRHL